MIFCTVEGKFGVRTISAYDFKPGQEIVLTAGMFSKGNKTVAPSHRWRVIEKKQSNSEHMPVFYELQPIAINQ